MIFASTQVLLLHDQLRDEAADGPEREAPRYSRQNERSDGPREKRKYEAGKRSGGEAAPGATPYCHLSISDCAYFSQLLPTAALLWLFFLHSILLDLRKLTIT